MKKQSLDTIIKDNLVILIDRREQEPFSYPRTKLVTLDYADYSFEFQGKDYRDKVVVERKGSVSELYSLTGSSRERFGRELDKMRNVKYKYMVCEFDLMEITNSPPPGVLQPSAVYGTLYSMMIKDCLPVLFCGNRVNARALVYKLFYFYVKYNIIGDDI